MGDASAGGAKIADKVALDRRIAGVFAKKPPPRSQIWDW